MPISSRHILNCIPATAKTLYVAYSGGVDSHVLLHLLANTCFHSKIVAIYINHGLQTVAGEWGEHCERVCEQLQLSFKAISVNVSRLGGESLEEAARNARYEAFKQIVAEDDVLLTAQHRDDQAETFLLQVLRGSGVAGLASMSMQAKFGEGVLLRPLLDVPRAEILEYANAQQLAWIEDPSNQQDNFDRNYLRQHVMPMLRERWPAVDKTVARSAEHCAEALGYIDSFADLHLGRVLDSDSLLDCSILREYKPNQQLLLVRHWLREFGLKPPSQAVTKAIIQQIVNARSDADPFLYIQGYEIRRYRNKLYCIASHLLRQSSLSVQVWLKSQQNLVLDNGQKLLAEHASIGINAEDWRDREVVIKPRQGGEKLRLPNRQGRHELKKLYQEAGIPPWERDMRPIIYLDGEIAAVAGLWVDVAFWGENMDCIQVKWQPE